MGKKQIDEVKGMSPGYEVADATSTGNAHANRKADKGLAADPMPKIQDSGSQLSNVEVISYVLKQMASAPGDVNLALYNKIKAEMESTSQSGNEKNLKSIATKEDIDPIFDGVELSEEAKEKALTIFEAAVSIATATRQAELAEEFETKLAEETTRIEEELVTKVDEFLNYVAEEWMTVNELAVGSGLRAEMAESFIAGMKSLFENHYVELPEEAVNVVEGLTDTVEALQEKLNEQIAKSITLTTTIEEMHVQKALSDISEGLTDTQKSKLSSLVENIDYTDVAEFTKKAKTIKEGFVTPKAKVLVEDTLNGGEPLQEEKTGPVLDPLMASYVKAASRITLK